LQDKHSSLNKATNLDVKTSSVSNAHQDLSKEDEMNVDSKDKEASASEMPDKVIENDLEENLNQDNEVPLDTSCNNFRRSACLRLDGFGQSGPRQSHA
jgi:hypothetical protein